jgi:glycosyltransferase involved in cell wall biosynthesis
MQSQQLGLTSGKFGARICGAIRLLVLLELELDFVRWTLEQYQVELQKFDIGIMPLEDTPWNRGKCGFKLIQYMAVGAAPIASPVGVYQEIISTGVNGFLAKDTNEWQQALRILIEDEVKRLQIGMTAWVRIKNDYSVASVFPALLNALRPASKSGVNG